MCRLELLLNIFIRTQLQPTYRRALLVFWQQSVVAVRSAVPSSLVSIAQCPCSSGSTKLPSYSSFNHSPKPRPPFCHLQGEYYLLVTKTCVWDLGTYSSSTCKKKICVVPFPDSFHHLQYRNAGRVLFNHSPRPRPPFCHLQGEYYLLVRKPYCKQARKNGVRDLGRWLVL